jgi:hypothetical protein
MTDRELDELLVDAMDSSDLEMVYKAQQALRDRLAQPEWVGLTDDEIFKLYMNSGYGDIDDCLQFEGLARVIEAKLKEKNT